MYVGIFPTLDDKLPESERCASPQWQHRGLPETLRCELLENGMFDLPFCAEGLADCRANKNLWMRKKKKQVSNDYL